MSSLKQLQQKSARKKQVYKPILDNPYTDEAHNWPYVEDQPLVAELVRSHVTEVLRHAPESLDARFGFNAVVKYLEQPSFETVAADEPSRVFLFVCNRDSVPSVLLAQIPVLARVSRRDVVLIPLPRGFVSHFDKCCPAGQYHDGLLLVVQNTDFDLQFASQLTRRVGHVTPKPWLKFNESRIGVVASEVSLNARSAKPTK
ncbi:LAME_0F06172g1_1 [Lachancea meyersii CBS 8951]|uniref:LAME_0F06172g1_1 n=1 Tax=Lachancea meyersii CBS 8951 TaxID=1266667 RepID=A0A1G4JTK2_9SACH|nr:LAME_0F06172g1_1 [Lachancea meyersii CBS 8951]